MIQDAFVAFSASLVKRVGNSSSTSAARNHGETTSLFSEDEIKQSHKRISAWPDYRPTPLLRLAGLANALSAQDILYKDEANRFGLGSFKALGGAYAVSQLAHAQEKQPAELTVTTATDGNHGRSVAWGAREHGHRAVIYIHAEVSAGREQAMQDLGAEVVRVDGNYDESVRICYEVANKNGWTVVSDTTHDGAGSDVARTVMLGYSVMLSEVVQQCADNIPTHVLVQGGVGGLAATVCECFRLAWGDRAPRMIVVEPELAPCLFASASNNAPTKVEIASETVMAGLSCGEVSSVAWPVLQQHADDFLTISDSIVAPTMTMLRDSPFADPAVVAGESAVAGLAAFIAARQDDSLSEALNLTKDSRVLVLGTEGATDPDVYQRMTGFPAEKNAHASISGK